MTFATEALKPSTERFVLVRFKPRKYVGVGVNTTGNYYTFSVDLPSVDVVEINASTTDVSGFTYADGVLTVNSSLDLEDVANVVVAEFHLLYTGSRARDTIDSFVSGRPQDIWNPRMESYPSWGQSMRNIGDGVFSISNTEITLLSPDRVLHGYFGDTFSWNKAHVQIWACIGDVTTSRTVFTGEVVAVNLTSSKVTISVADAFQKLNETATFGSKERAYCLNGGAFTTVVQPADENRPIPMVIGRSSPMFVSPGYRISEAFGTPSSTDFYHLSDGLKCVPTSGNINTSSTVQFLCGKGIGNGVKHMSFGTISAAYEHYLTKTVKTNDDNEMEVVAKMTYLQCSSFSGEIGDYIPSLNSWVCAIGAFTHAATNFNLAVCDVNYFIEQFAYTSGSISPPTLSTTIPSMSVWIDGKEDASYDIYYQPLALVPHYAVPTYSGRYVPFTVQEDTVNINGYAITYVYATVSSSDIGGIIPGKIPMKCRFSPESPLSHADALAFVVKNSGMEINTTSFDNADTDLSAEVITCCPSFGESAFPSYLKIAQLITSSTFGLLIINQDREVEYVLLDEAIAATATGERSTTNMIEGDTSSVIEYQDIATNILFQNDNYIDQDYTPVTNISYPIAASLHKNSNSKVVKHCLLSMTNRKDVIGKYASNPKIEYNLSTGSEDLVSNIGDKLDLTNPAVAALSESTSGVIVSINTSSQKTNVTINELRGVL